MKNRIVDENLSNVGSILNMKKGNEMTFQEANEGLGNVNYLKGEEYRINCQSCVVANELRRRGFDVTALPNLKKEGSIPMKLSYKTNMAWIDPITRKMPDKRRAGGEYVSKGKIKVKTTKELASEFVELIKDDGRYHIDYKNKNGSSGHIITLEKMENGKIRIYDPQNGKDIEWANLREKVDLKHGINVLKVDNLLINTDIVDGIVTRR